MEKQRYTAAKERGKRSEVRVCLVVQYSRREVTISVIASLGKISTVASGVCSSSAVGVLLRGKRG